MGSPITGWKKGEIIILNGKLWKVVDSKFAYALIKKEQVK